jgi:hypothetical protein
LHTVSDKRPDSVLALHSYGAAKLATEPRQRVCRPVAPGRSGGVGPIGFCFGQSLTSGRLDRGRVSPDS